jgi:hypothetical protein
MTIQSKHAANEAAITGSSVVIIDSSFDSVIMHTEFPYSALVWLPPQKFVFPPCYFVL